MMDFHIRFTRLEANAYRLKRNLSKSHVVDETGDSYRTTQKENRAHMVITLY